MQVETTGVETTGETYFFGASYSSPLGGDIPLKSQITFSTTSSGVCVASMSDEEFA